MERCFQDFSNGILQAPKFLKFHLVKSETICSHLAIGEQASQKNRNGKTIVVLFLDVFYECIEGKPNICLLLAMFIGDDRMIDLMIIYTEKTFAKAFDISDIIKKNYGDISSMSPNLSINNQIWPPIDIWK